MITKNVEGKYELDIFRRFVVDESLPKHKSIRDYSSNGMKSKNIFESDVDSFNSTFAQSNDLYTTGRNGEIFFGLKWLFNKISKWTTEKKRIKSEMGKVPVEVVFNNICNNFESLSILKDRLSKHRNAIKYAEQMGQLALVEDLKKKQNSVELEDVLFVSGYKQYIEEQAVISFALNCERGLRLDWIKNFTRLIPLEAGEKKILLDKLCIFDNYVVLHYDPKNESTKLTDEERKKKEDPILFGVIEGSRKLYHIHSWKDELCDLTIDQIIEKHPDAVKVIE
jgi:hypothetical protein